VRRDPVRGRRTMTLIFENGDTVQLTTCSVLGREPNSYSDGNAEVSAVSIKDPSMTMSKSHFAVGPLSDGWWIEDRNSSNGTAIKANGVTTDLAPMQRIAMPPGSIIVAGDRLIETRTTDARDHLGNQIAPPLVPTSPSVSSSEVARLVPVDEVASPIVGTGLGVSAAAVSSQLPNPVVLGQESTAPSGLTPPIAAGPPSDPWTRLAVDGPLIAVLLAGLLVALSARREYFGWLLVGSWMPDVARYPLVLAVLALTGLGLFRLVQVSDRGERRNVIAGYASLALALLFRFQLDGDVPGGRWGTRLFFLAWITSLVSVVVKPGVVVRDTARLASAGSDGASQPQAHPTYAGFGVRLGGRLIDGLITLVPEVLLYAGLGAGVAADNVGVVYAALGVALIGFVLLVVVFAVMLGRGGTPGMRAVGLKCVDQHTLQPIGTGRAIGRMLAVVVSLVPCYLGFFNVLWDPKRQTWHDKIVGSVVVKAAG
jgi:uncharacterized RDD family membrane protein YckC